MPHEFCDYCDLPSRLATLGLASADGIALLPRNLRTAGSREDLVQESTVTEVRTLLRQAGVAECRLDREGASVAVLQEKSLELILPTIFIGSLVMSGNAAAANIAFGVVANYATEFFRGAGGKRSVRFSVVVMHGACGIYKEYKYAGDPAGIAEFNQVVKQAEHGDHR